MGDLQSNHKATPYLKDTPLEKWPDSWLISEVANLLDEPGYHLMTENERKQLRFPSSVDERREYIEQYR